MSILKISNYLKENFTISNKVFENSIYKTYFNFLNSSTKITYKDKILKILREIKLNSSNALEIDGDDFMGTFNVENEMYVYIISQFEDNPNFYNVGFANYNEFEKDTRLDVISGKGYIKILSTMYKIINTFLEKHKPDLFMISSNEEAGYTLIYKNLVKENPIPGYMIKTTHVSFKKDDKNNIGVLLKKIGVEINYDPFSNRIDDEK